MDPFLIMQAMNIIAEETGITMAEMKNDVAFADVGVDSLLSLAVCGRLREELNMPDLSSTLFMEYSTVADLKRWLGATSSSSGPVSDSSADDDSKPLAPESGFVFSFLRRGHSRDLQRRHHGC